MENELSQLLKVRREKLKELSDCGRDPFKITKFEGQVHAQEIKDNYEKYDGKPVTVAGRVMSKRRMGKIGFAHLQDLTGKIQLVVKKDTLGEEEYEFFKKLDIGDIVGATGTIFTTDAGEISVATEKMTILSKSLLPLPEKFHGLQDPDLRRSQRCSLLKQYRFRSSSANILRACSPQEFHYFPLHYPFRYALLL